MADNDARWTTPPLARTHNTYLPLVLDDVAAVAVHIVSAALEKPQRLHQRPHKPPLLSRPAAPVPNALNHARHEQRRAWNLELGQAAKQWGWSCYVLSLCTYDLNYKNLELAKYEESEVVGKPARPVMYAYTKLSS